MTRLQILSLPLLALLLASPPALAAADDEEEQDQQPWDARWSLALSTEVDQQSNRGLEAAGGYALTPTTTVFVGANSIAYSPTVSNGFHSDGIEAGLSHDFRHFTLSGAIGRWQDSDILTAEEAKLGFDLRFKPWSVGLRAMYRRSGFEPVDVNATITLRDLTQLPVLATSSCTLSNEGYGIHAEFAGDVWGAHASAMSYQYKDASCSFGMTQGLDVLDHPVKTEFVQLEAPLVTQLETIGVRRIGRENTLLASEIDAGASWKRQDLIVSLDVTHQQEYFSGAGSNTFAATGTADMGHNSGVDVTIGITRGSTVVSGAFVGFAVRAHF